MSLQHLLVERQIRHHLAQPAILLLELVQLLELRRKKPAIKLVLGSAFIARPDTPAAKGYEVFLMLHTLPVASAYALGRDEHRESSVTDSMSPGPFRPAKCNL
jgi:hypothetical protein